MLVSRWSNLHAYPHLMQPRYIILRLQHKPQVRRDPRLLLGQTLISFVDCSAALYITEQALH